MSTITFTPTKDQGHGTLTNIAVFPGETFGAAFPEAIGDTHNPIWFGEKLITRWEQADDGHWRALGEGVGESVFSIAVEPAEEYVDFKYVLTNTSERTWTQSFAFNCFQIGSAPSVADFESARHWVRSDGQFKRLVELPHVFSRRPTVQLYTVEGAPEGKEIPFVRAFDATPVEVKIQGWIALVAKDGKRLAATVSKPPLFTFNNMEYSCIHCAPSFGQLEPGESGTALNRVYFVETTVEVWYERMRRELYSED